MDSTLMGLQQALKQQNEDLRDELKELELWQADVERREAANKKKAVPEPQQSLPPVRGTVPSLKAYQQANNTGKSKEDPIQVAKDQGNEYFKVGKLDDAVRLYTKGIDMDPDSASTHVLYANRAMCYIKLQEFEKAERDTTKCVQMNRGYAKAFYRRAVARKALKKYKDARQDLETVLALQPGDNDAEVELKAVTLLLREENRKSEGAASATRKKIVITEVDDEDDEEASLPKDDQNDESEHPEETAARQKRIERDMQELEAKRRQEEERRRIDAQNEERERQRSRQTNSRVELIEEEEEPIPAKPAAPAPVKSVSQEKPKSESAKRECSQNAPVPRNIKVAWTKENISTPKNFPEFERVYNDVRENVELFDTLLNAVPASAYKVVFGVNLSPELLVDILRSAERGSGSRAKEIIESLSKLSRVGELAMFFNEAETTTLKSVLGLVQSSGASTAEVAKYRKAFEL